MVDVCCWLSSIEVGCQVLNMDCRKLLSVVSGYSVSLVGCRLFVSVIAQFILFFFFFRCAALHLYAAPNRKANTVIHLQLPPLPDFQSARLDKNPGGVTPPAFLYFSLVVWLFQQTAAEVAVVITVFIILYLTHYIQYSVGGGEVGTVCIS